MKIQTAKYIYSKLAIILILLMQSACSNREPVKQNLFLKDSISVKPDSIVYIPKYDSKVLYKDTFLLGNFDLKKGKDTAWLMVPMDTFEMYGCEPCISEIIFPNSHDSIISDGDIGGDLANVGDLNRDGADELIYFTASYYSCWSTLSVFSFLNNAWTKVAYTAFHGCAGNLDLRKRLKRISKDEYELIGSDVDGSDKPTRFKFE